MQKDRMPPMDAAELDDARRAAIAEFEAVRSGGLMGPFVPLLRSPELMRTARAMGDYLRYRSVLPARLRELLILLTAREWTQQTEWSIHRDAALDAGVSAETIHALAEGRRPDAMSPDEAVLHDLFVELHRCKSVSDATYSRARERLGEQGVVEAVGIVGYYTLLAMVMNVARTEPPPDAGPRLKALPS